MCLKFQQHVTEDTSVSLLPLEKEQKREFSKVGRQPRSRVLKSTLQHGFSPERSQHSELKDNSISKQYCSIFGEKVRPLECSPIRSSLVLGVCKVSLSHLSCL